MTAIADAGKRPKYAMKHGHAISVNGHAAHSPTYKIWAGMKQRCSDPNHNRYMAYGGRGIKICERWLNFENFLADMGAKPSSGHSIDRIDNNGNYEPSNCRWATRCQQQRNKRLTPMLTFRGETMAVADWADRFNMSYKLLWLRLKYGWPMELAITKQRYPRAALAAYRQSKERT